MDEQAGPPPAPVVGSDYWSQSRRPLASLIFTAPLLVIYETGLICLGPERDAQRGRRLAAANARFAGIQGLFPPSRAHGRHLAGLAPCASATVACSSPSALHHARRMSCPGRRSLAFLELVPIFLAGSRPYGWPERCRSAGDDFLLPGSRHLRRVALPPDPAELGDRPASMDEGKPCGQRDRRDRVDERVVFGGPLRRPLRRPVWLADFLLPLSGRRICSPFCSDIGGLESPPARMPSTTCSSACRRSPTGNSRSLLPEGTLTQWPE